MAKRLDIFACQNYNQCYKYYIFEVNFFMQQYQVVSSTISRRDMYYSSLDSSRRGALNGGRIMSLGSLDRKLFAFFSFEIFANILLSIDSSDVIRPPFDASHQDESNELRLVIF